MNPGVRGEKLHDQKREKGKKAIKTTYIQSITTIFQNNFFLLQWKERIFKASSRLQDRCKNMLIMTAQQTDQPIDRPCDL